MKRQSLKYFLLDFFQKGIAGGLKTCFSQITLLIFITLWVAYGMEISVYGVSLGIGPVRSCYYYVTEQGPDSCSHADF